MGLIGRLVFEKQQLVEGRARVKKLEGNVAKENEVVKQLESESIQQSELEQELVDQIKQLTVKMQEYRVRVTDKAEASNDAKNASRKFVKEIDAQTKLISTKEAQADRLGSETLGLLKQCQLEQIDIPFENDQELQNISFEEPEDEGMDETEGFAEASAHQAKLLKEITIDFSGLSRDEKENGADEIDMEFDETIKKITEQIHALAPSVNASDKLDDVENKLKETAQEFEQARKESKDAKEKFNKIKQERFVTFF
jgi:structural maintenance of chromosome 1